MEKSKLILIATLFSLAIGNSAFCGPKTPKIEPKFPEFKIIVPATPLFKVEFLKKNGIAAAESDLQAPMKVSILNMGKEGEYGLNFKNAYYVSGFNKNAILKPEGVGSPGTTGQVEIWFKAKANRAYMLDCAVIGGNNYIARFGGGITQQAAVSNRIYIIVPPRPSEINNAIYLTATSNYSMWTFQECEITQIGN